MGKRSPLRPERAVNLGFVDLTGDKRPKTGVEYNIAPASSGALEGVDFPHNSEFKRLNLTLNGLYIEDLPDWTMRNEGLLKLQVNTRDPQEIEASPTKAVFATEFSVGDDGFAPGFLYRGVYRNILFREHVNVKVDLFELDEDVSKSYAQLKQVIDSVPELKTLDVLSGLPYLSLAAKLFDGIITTFGKNSDDYIWGTVPTLEADPGPGSAFLRSGIYVLFEAKYHKDHREQGISKGDGVSIDELKYQDGKIRSTKNVLPNHLIFNLRIRPHLTNTGC